MMKKIITVITSFIFISFTAQAQEKELVLATIMTTLPAHCAPTKEMGKVFTEEQLVFTGLVDRANVFKIFINKNGAWSSMLQNVAGISCVYFSGVPGMLKVPEVKSSGT